MTVTLSGLRVEAADPARLAQFWDRQLGAEAAEWLTFHRQATPKTVKNRVHVDVYVRSLDPLLDLGARLLDDYLPTRVTMADVEGNEFCAFLDAEAATDPPARVFAVCTDSDRPEELAAWWASLVGARIAGGTDGTPRWLYGSSGWPELIWKFVRVHDPRVVPNRWSFMVANGADQLLTAGAAESKAGVLLDPQGNEIGLSEPLR